MSVVLEDSDFDRYRDMPVAEFCSALRDVAEHIDLKPLPQNDAWSQKRSRRFVATNAKFMCRRKVLSQRK